MRSILLLGAVAVGLVVTDPAVCAQAAPPPAEGTQPMPTDPVDPAQPSPMPDPAKPSPPVTEPLPPEMPMPAGEAQDMSPSSEEPNAPAVIDRSLPAGPAATPPSAGADAAVSGSTTTQGMAPQPATKAYPLCTKTLQDSCRNPGEGPKAPKRR